VPTVEIDTELFEQAQALREHAHSLRTQADALSPVLATTYRRRASELELEAWVLEVQSNAPAERIHAAA
jgi:hypothetical protein